MVEKKNKETRSQRLAGTLWGALLGTLLGTALSSALAHVLKPESLMRSFLIQGITIGIPNFDTTLGFFHISFGFSFRFTLLSAFFMLLVAALMLFIPFKKNN